MILLRLDTLYDIKVKRPDSAVLMEFGLPSEALFGMKVRTVPAHLNDILTVPHYSVEKLPGKKKRRKAYRVKCERRPCAFFINEDALKLKALPFKLDL